jgi:hypothetical protein
MAIYGKRGVLSGLSHCDFSNTLDGGFTKSTSSDVYTTSGVLARPTTMEIATHVTANLW